MAEGVLSTCLTACATSFDAACVGHCLDEHGWALHKASGLPTWAAVLLAASLIPLSAIFSGLTLGLLSLDMFSLKVKAAGGGASNDQQGQQARPCRVVNSETKCMLVLAHQRWAPLVANPK
jgi:metal transporter CNNM